LVDRLIDLGHNVTVIDNESADSNEQFYWNPKAKNYKHDVRDYSNICELFKGQDAVFHLAADARIQPSISDPIKAINNNVMGTATVLECARVCGVKRVLYSSTSAAYGLANTLLQTAILKPSCKSKKVKNLYYTGQLTVPGPGVPPSLISGEVVAGLIHHDFKNN
jgi:nucleoside-diphosphate-sugar epimerase